MGDIAMRLDPKVRPRIEALAEMLGVPVDECLQMAILEFLKNWESHHEAIETVESRENSPVFHELAL